MMDNSDKQMLMGIVGFFGFILSVLPFLGMFITWNWDMTGVRMIVDGYRV